MSLDKGGPDASDPWPAECKFDYYRHFVFDQTNPACSQDGFSTFMTICAILNKVVQNQ